MCPYTIMWTKAPVSGSIAIGINPVQCQCNCCDLRDIGTNITKPEANQMYSRMNNDADDGLLIISNLLC